MPQRRTDTPDVPEFTVGRVGDKGRITLPLAVRRRYGLKEGDLVAITETSQGILIAPRAAIAQALLDRLNVALGDIPLDEWIEAGRAERAELARELYGISAAPASADQGVR